MAVVREDVVKIGFDIEESALTDLIKMLDDLKQMLKGGIGEDAFDEMAKESKKTNDSLDDLRKTIDGIKPDNINKTAKGLKDTDDKAEDAHKELKKIDKLNFNSVTSGAKRLSNALGNVAVQGGLALAKATALAATGISAMATQSVGTYANYEQLVGGVETIFKDSAGTVQKYADEAFRSAGLSQNAYMETVTGFSASLIQSLGGDTGAAAEYADRAIRDMSDNANKMGTDMGSIQYAYQGFAKQNYTMLDNLKLGYGGTKEEMERLLADAEKLTGKDLDISSYADVIDAIHAIQDSMGITGTTAAEADKTITGSASAMKASWSNMMNALVLGGEDFDKCLDNLVETTKTFMKNLMPALTQSLSGIGDMIVELAPIIEKEFPALVEALLPPLIKAAASLVRGLITALPTIIETLTRELPVLLSEIWEAVEDVFGGRFPSVEKVGELFGHIGKFCMDNEGVIKQMVPALIALISGFKLLKKLGGFSSLFSKTGVGGGGVFSGFTSLAKMPISTVLKGMGNISVILGGFVLLALVFMWAAPYMAELSDVKSVLEVLLVTSLVGLLGTAMTTLAGKVGNIPIATVAKGVADIGVAMIGFGALAALLMWLAPYMAQLSDIKTTLEILVIIGLVGLVGSALAGLAGVVGVIPISTVLTGLGNIALALGGFTAIVEAFGLMTQISGFTEFLEKGGEVLVKICGILGEMVGAVIGGFAEGVTDGLPGIGTNISGFATNVQSALTTFNTFSSDGLKDFAAAFGEFLLVMAGDALLSWFTGERDYAKLGTDLSTLATNLSTFFTKVNGIEDGAFAKATALFDCLAGVKSLPTEGGVRSWFAGDINYDTVASGIEKLASAKVITALSTIAQIPDTAFTKLTAYFNALAGVKSLPKDGGVVQWFTGTISYDGLADGLETLTSEKMMTALTKLSGIPDTAYTGITGLFGALADVKSLPKEGGVLSWFAGSDTKGLKNVASELPGVATNIAKFFTNIGERTDFSPISSLFNTLSGIEIETDAAEKGFWSGVSDLGSMGTGLGDFAKNGSAFFTMINTLDTDKLSTFFEELGTVGDLPENLSSINSTIGTELANLNTTSSTHLEALKGNFNDNLGAIITTMNTTATAAYNSGVAIAEGLKNGMNAQLSTLITAAQTMAASIQSAFDVELDINSPSKKMEKSGGFVGIGAINGLRDKIPEAKATAMDFARAATPFNSYTPESSASTYNTSSHSEVMNVSPVFNLNITGSQDDRSLARKVKRYVSQAVSESLESLERKTYVVREA